MRERFVVADPDLIYLDGNSLGRLPVAAEAALRESVTQRWGHDLVRAWPGWLDEPTRVGDVLAAGVLGAEPGEVLVGDSTTVNLYKLAGAAAVAARNADARQTTLVTTASNFPTDRYVLAGLADLLGMRLRLIEYGELDDALAVDTALLCLSHVEYVSGESTTWQPSPSSPARGACGCSGISPIQPAASRSASRSPGPNWPSGVHTST
jgi:kynureninase